MFNFLRKKKARLFGEIAVFKGLASVEDVEDALRIQKELRENSGTHKEIGTILVEKGVLTTRDVSAILEDQKERTGLTAWFSAFFGLSR